MRLAPSLLLLFCFSSSVSTFSTAPLFARQQQSRRPALLLSSSSSDANEGEEEQPSITPPPADDDDDDVEPGKMRVSEIKAELDMRNVDYSDCFDKESLVERLQEARASGKADPSILDKFNKQKLEQQFKEQKFELRDEDIESVIANDGTLPGGLTPDQFKKLAGNPEIMSFLQSTKMQECMKLMMTGGRDELERKLREDPELQETVVKLNQILGSVQ